MKFWTSVSLPFFSCFMLAQVQSQWIENCPRDVRWSLADTASNKSCILISGTYELLIPYTRQTGKLTNAHVIISPNSTVSGTCGSNSSRVQTITLTWPVQTLQGDNNDTGNSNTTEATPNNQVTFLFTRNTTTGRPDGVEGFFCLQRFTAQIHANPIQFRDSTEPNKTYTLEAATLEKFSTALGTSYFCSSMQDVPVGNATLRVAHAQIEIFHRTPLAKNGLDFGPRSYCFADGLRMMITAIVLVTLLVATGGFVIYMYNRQRRQSNYNKM